MPLWQLHWERKSFKQQWKKKQLILLNGVNSANCELNCTWEIIELFHSPICRTIPSHGNTADISLTVLHRNFLGVDEFLGQVSLPLRDFDVYERPKSTWFSLKCKPGQSKNDYRGEIEVFIEVFWLSSLCFCYFWQTSILWCCVVFRLNWVLP